MIARREWYTLPISTSITSDGTTAFIEVDAEALEKLLRDIQCCIEPAVQACKYDEAVDLINSYKDLEELLMALLNPDKEAIIENEA